MPGRRERRRRARRRDLERGHDPVVRRREAARDILGPKASPPSAPAAWHIGVEVGDANGDWWVHVPTKQTVTVHGGSISMPFLPAARKTGTIRGEPGTQLAGYLAETVSVPQRTIDAAQAAFATP